MPQSDTIDVKMPDGVIVRGVPKGMSKHEVMRRYASSKAPKPPAPVKAQTRQRPSLWEALNKPPGTDIEESLRNRISAWAGTHLPAKVAGPVAQGADILAGTVAAPIEMGREFSTPLNALAMGGGAAGLKALAGTYPRVAAALGKGVGGLFSAQGAYQALSGGPAGETTPEAIKRRVGGAGQALLAFPFSGQLLKSYKNAELPKLHPEAVRDMVGRALGEQINAAVNKVGATEVSRHAENVAKAVDDPKRNPVPAIDAQKYVDTLQTAWNRYFQISPKVAAVTPGNSRAGSALKAIFEEAQGKIPGKSVRWTWKQAQQVRSALDDVVRNADDRRMKAVASKVRTDLSQDMASEAQKAGVASDFAAYNTLHSRLERVREKYGNRIREAKSGKDVFDALSRDSGYVRNTLPELKRYGLDPDAVLSAMDLAGKSKQSNPMWENWAFRHLGGAMSSAMGLGFTPGYLAVGLAARGPKAGSLETSPYMRRGQQLVEQGRIPPPSAIATPTPVPESPPERPAAAAAQPPTRPAPRIEAGTRVEPQPPRPEPPSSPYLKTARVLARVRSLNDIIQRITKGRQLEDAEYEQIEKASGIDAKDPANLPAIRRFLIDERNKLIRAAGRLKKGEKP